MNNILYDGIIVCEGCRRIFFPDDENYTQTDQPCEICGEQTEEGAAEKLPLESESA